MDFLKGALESQTGHKPSHTNNPEAEHKPEHHQTETQSHTKPHKQPSTSELMASAKVVADAAKAKMGHTNEEFDKVKVAGAVGDLLDGVKHYAKLEENAGLGMYVGKAETYLHKYESSHSGGPTAAAAAGAVAEEEEEKKKKEDGHEHGHGHGHGGAGDYFKMAEGFLKK